MLLDLQGGGLLAKVLRYACFGDDGDGPGDGSEPGASAVRLVCRAMRDAFDCEVMRSVRVGAAGGEQGRWALRALRQADGLRRVVLEAEAPGLAAVVAAMAPGPREGLRAVSARCLAGVAEGLAACGRRLPRLQELSVWSDEALDWRFWYDWDDGDCRAPALRAAFDLAGLDAAACAGMQRLCVRDAMVPVSNIEALARLTQLRVVRITGVLQQQLPLPCLSACTGLQLLEVAEANCAAVVGLAELLCSPAMLCLRSVSITDAVLLDPELPRTPPSRALRELQLRRCDTEASCVIAALDDECCRRLTLLALVTLGGLQLRGRFPALARLEVPRLTVRDVATCTALREASLDAEASGPVGDGGGGGGIYFDISELRHLRQLQRLTLNARGAPSLRAMACCTALVHLVLFADSASSVAPLARCSGLASLDLHCRQLANVRPLARCGRLAAVTLRQCAHLADLAPLRLCPALAALGILGCRAVDSIEDVAAMPALTRLELSDLPALRSVAPIARCAMLDELVFARCGRVGHDDMRDALRGCGCLRRLRYGGRNVAPDGVAGLFCGAPALRFLEVANVLSIGDLDAVSGCCALTRLDVQWCRYLTTAGALATLEALEELRIDNCWFLRSIEGIGACSRLKRLRVIASALTDISDLARCGALRELRLLHSMVEDISPLAACAQLEQLDLKGSPVFCVEALRGLQRLRRLCLDSCKFVQEDALRPLADCGSLERVVIDRSDWSLDWLPCVLRV